MRLRGGCWPSAVQTELLRAAVLRGPDGVRAWERWKRAVDLERLDAGSSRLLGHVYRNLQQSGVEDPAMSTLRDVHRRTWRENHLRLHDAASVLARLRARGIESMLLKGAALVAVYHGDAGFRPMEDVDVLVRTHQAAAAVETLAALGWTPKQPVTPRHLRASHAMAFTGPHGQQVDLHWHLLPESCWSHADARLWECATVSRLHDVEIRVLDPAHQLFHACVHGVRWEAVAPLRWIADAAVILSQPAALDWDRLVEETERHQLALPVREALAYLREAIGLAVPPDTMERLRRIRVSASQRLDHRWRTRPASRLFGRLPEHWLRYRRLRRAQAERNPITFIGYLEVTFGCEGLRDLSHRALLRHRWRRRSQASVTDYERELTAAGRAAARSAARS